MKVVLAIDSFKGCLTSAEANGAAAAGVRRVLPEADVVQVPVSDGGEGFVEAFRAATGGQLMALTVSDPLGRPVTARYLLHGRTAVIEMAQASGLALLSASELNPLAATSYGTGQLVADAVRHGAVHVVVGLGGSATSDAGMGMLRALIDSFAPQSTWDRVDALHGVRFTVATDVGNPLCGARGAARVFGPQKGATEAMVTQLDLRARRFAEASARHFGYDSSLLPGAGAAGGLGYAFMQYLRAERRSGIDFLLDAVGFEQLVQGAGLIVTGEGTADRQTLMGKLPTGILRRSAGVPVCLVAGRVSDGDALLRAGFARVEAVSPEGLPLAEAMQRDVALRNLSRCVAALPELLAIRPGQEPTRQTKAGD